MDRIWNRRIGSGWMFDLELPLDEVAAGYEAMDTRQPLKVLLCPDPAPTKESQPDESHLRLH
jgi:threonine dehydrogenase-like Zn-dependent dehydrogenase